MKLDELKYVWNGLMNIEDKTERFFSSIELNGHHYGVVFKIFDNTPGTLKIWDLKDLDMQRTVDDWKTKDPITNQEKVLTNVRNCLSVWMPVMSVELLAVLKKKLSQDETKFGKEDVVKSTTSAESTPKIEKLDEEKEVTNETV